MLHCQRQHALDSDVVDRLTVGEQEHPPRRLALADGVHDGECVASGRERRWHRQLECVRRSGEGEVGPPTDQVERVPAEPVAEGEDDPFGPLAVGVDVGRDVEPAPQHRDGFVGDGTTAGPERARRAGGPDRRDESPEAVDQPVRDGQDVVALRLGIPQLAQALQPFRLVVGAVGRLGEVHREVEKLPAVIVEVAAAHGELLLVEDAGADVVGRRLPSLVVDGARAHHLEVLRVVQLGGGRVLRAWREG